ncbi:MAG: restriction endonuclease subunit S [Ruminococcus sp.]|nr:restriction endonuclease subunit S [Ruminococcus sp.]
MNNPKLRFKREDGTEFPLWEKEKWSNLGHFVPSGTLSKADLSDNGTPCILYGELYTKYGEIANTIYSKTNATSHIYSKADDVILPKSGETPEDISTATCIPYDNISLGGDLIVFRHNEKVIGTYLSYLISNRAKNAIASIAQGKSVVHISEKSLSNIELSYPNPEEQQKIADFLSTVDEVIAQSEAEVQNLEQQKKGVMQKIFSQKVRFRREDGTDFPEWEIKKLGELTKQVNIKNNTSRNYPVYSINNQKGFIPQIDQFEDREVASTDKSNYRVVDYHQFAYNPSRINVGSIAYLKDKINVIVSPLYVIFECLTELNPEFLDIYVRTSDFHKQRKINTAGSVRDSLSYEGFADIKTAIPCFEEQQKIADFLSAYDEAITCTKQELEKWKELKKGLFQQMFV